MVCLYKYIKLVGAGADFVMLGGMFSGHDQTEGEVIERNGKRMKLFYGMSSATAMNKHVGGVANYRCGILCQMPLAIFCLRPARVQEALCFGVVRPSIRPGLLLPRYLENPWVDFYHTWPRCAP